METNNTLNTQLSNQLQETKTQIKNIIESIDVGTWERNLKTGEITFSKRWTQMTGYDLDKSGLISGDMLKDITHPDDYAESGRLINEHISGNLPYYKYESRIKHKNGNWVWICERGGVISRDGNGKPLLMFGTHTDITKKKRIVESLENYIHTLNHDLKSPLSLINGYSSFLIEEDCTKEEINKYASMISYTGNKMMKMMESYLLLAKIERGQQIQNKTEKSMQEIKENIDNVYKNIKKVGNLEYIIEDGVLKQKVLIDEILFDSMISNILHNAIDASSKIDGKILINIDMNEECINIGFFNSGKIPREIEKKLFKKFTSSKSNGTGLGLYSARIIARAHGGDIVYEPADSGTKFVFCIPIC